MIELKNIYRARELKFYDLLKGVQKDLLDDFSKLFPDFLNGGSLLSARTYQNPSGTNEMLYESKTEEPWKVTGVKAFGSLLAEKKEVYPTAFKIAEMFGDDCFMATYSLFEPNTILYRHTGTENREAKFIRIHIPLYIPAGDVGFEVEGEVIHWDDIFAFNNQKLHSAWNGTNERRLVFLLDLTREVCGFPPAPAWYPGMNDHVPPFEKTKGPTL